MDLVVHFPDEAERGLDGAVVEIYVDELTGWTADIRIPAPAAP